MNKVKDIAGVLMRDLTFSQKFNYLKYRMSARKEILDYDPVTISIVATSRCTFSCDMCPTHSKRVPADYEHAQTTTRDMDFAMFKEIIDRFENALNVQIIGSGEPMLNKNFFKMVDYAAMRHMTVKTFSNGTTIEDNLDNILNSKLDGITISINGHNAKEFNRMTGMDENYYAKIYRAIKNLVDERNRRNSPLKVKLSFIVDRQNYKYIPDMIQTSLNLGVDHTFLCNFLPCPVEGLTAEERSLMADPKIRREIRSIMNAYPPLVRRKFTLPPLIDKTLRQNKCVSHFSQVRFDGDGNISSCSMMLLNMEGNGNYRDEEIWNNAFFRRMRNVFLSSDAEKLPGPCRVCPDNKGVLI
ncbi:MAG: radical SAM protein [Candidatus Omnitrophica bacterium]|nr:radical SAM protein [Candidatus Omnitrophota bacterium]